MSRRAILLLILLGWGRSAYAQPEGVVVVLSSESGPYQEALAGFRESFKQPFDTFFLSKGQTDIPKSVSLIVAIGGKAAVYPYEARNAPLVYCVSPGVSVDPEKHPGPLLKVYVSPPPQMLLQKLKELQPGLRRLAAIWVGESAFSYGGTLKKEGDRMLVSVLAKRIQSLDELPDHLRSLKGRVDAFWVPPDPLLITPQSFNVMRQFALDNNLPMYASIDGLADKGATASVSVSFREMGLKAGVLAAQVLSGAAEISNVEYGDHVQVTINAASAKQSGLSVPEDILKRADRVIP